VTPRVGGWLEGSSAHPLTAAQNQTVLPGAEPHHWTLHAGAAR
jgi:hypothetical protein